MKWSIVILSLTTLILGGCIQTDDKVICESETNNSCAVERTLTGTIDIVLHSLKSFDYQTLATFASKEGILFSPYGYIDNTTNTMLSKEQIIQAGDSQEGLTRGYYEGAGTPIKLSFKSYREKFIYNAPFIEQGEIYEELIQRGSALYNVFEIYPDATIIEYYIPGENPEYGGMDRKSLVLVLEQEKGLRKIRAIIHRQWTI